MVYGVVFVGVDPGGVAMPDVDVDVLHRRVRLIGQLVQREREQQRRSVHHRHPIRAGRQVGTLESFSSTKNGPSVTAGGLAAQDDRLCGRNDPAARYAGEHAAGCKCESGGTRASRRKIRPTSASSLSMIGPLCCRAVFERSDCTAQRAVSQPHTLIRWMIALEGWICLLLHRKPPRKYEKMIRALFRLV